MPKSLTATAQAADRSEGGEKMGSSPQTALSAFLLSKTPHVSRREGADLARSDDPTPAAEAPSLGTPMPSAMDAVPELLKLAVLRLPPV